MKHKRPTNRAGLQGFHGRDIALPCRPADRSDPRRSEVRSRRFTDVAATRTCLAQANM